MEQLKLGQVLPLPCFNYSAEGQPLGKARQQDVQSPVKGGPTSFLPSDNAPACKGRQDFGDGLQRLLL